MRERILGCNDIMECRSAYTNNSSTDDVRLLTLGKTLILNSDKPKPSSNIKMDKKPSLPGWLREYFKREIYFIKQEQYIADTL